MKILIAAVLISAPLAAVFAGHPPYPTKQTSSPPIIIILDPGHGGTDRGGPHENGFPLAEAGGKRAYAAEDAYTYDVAKRIERLAVKNGLKTAITVTAKNGDAISEIREPDLIPAHTRMSYNLPRGNITPFRNKKGLRLRLRAARYIQKENPGATAVWISLHFDYASSPKISGTKIYTAKGLRDHPFVKALEEEFRKNSLSYADKGAAKNPVNDRNGLIVLKEGWIVPRVLVELGNFRNPRDRKLMLSPRGRERYARIVFSAIEDYENSLRGKHI
ncbi:MAG TPA: N-acetylmuramoyl-L-alanine amidase [Candidatus Paceibacterota bacterium]|nr:N-acetylmuramoyl-L-alanine amidase [Candidatus Paceibacterota bacterium]